MWAASRSAYSAAVSFGDPCRTEHTIMCLSRGRRPSHLRSMSIMVGATPECPYVPCTSADTLGISARHIATACAPLPQAHTRVHRNHRGGCPLSPRVLPSIGIFWVLHQASSWYFDEVAPTSQRGLHPDKLVRVCPTYRRASRRYWGFLYHSLTQHRMRRLIFSS